MSPEFPLIQPELSADELLNAIQFTALHLYTETESRGDYRAHQIAAWEQAVRTGNRRPMWLRRNFEDTDEFSAVVDYCIFDKEGDQHTFASLEFDGSGGARDIAVQLSTAGDGSPFTVATFPFDLGGTAQAIRHVEKAFVSISTLG